jgi:hypothetical protein
MDAAQAGAGPEQIELAVAQALQRGLTTRKRLEQAAGERGRRVQSLIKQALTLIHENPRLVQTLVRDR